mgnify:CR=1 FL=1|jgi:hypothetical protein
MSLTANKNFLQPTGFRVAINRDKYANIEFFVQSVNHPGATVNALELSVPKISQIPFQGDKITYSELSLSIIMDEDMESYKEVQRWMEESIDAMDDISADITLVILSSHNNKNNEIRYKNCIPTNIGSFELNSTSGATPIIVFDATFRFSDFEII